MATDTPRDLQLDTDGDFAISGGDLQIVSGADAIVQAVKIRLQFFRGEWYLDEDAGLPYFQSVLVKNPDPNVLHSVFRRAILDTPGVLEITSLTLTFDRAERTLTVAFRISTDVGELDSSVEL
jgi:hypothetical protein